MENFELIDYVWLGLTTTLLTVLTLMFVGFILTTIRNWN